MKEKPVFQNHLRHQCYSLKQHWNSVSGKHRLKIYVNTFVCENIHVRLIFKLDKIYITFSKLLSSLI